MFDITENTRTTNTGDHVVTQQNGAYAYWNLYYVSGTDITKGIIGFLNLAVVRAFQYVYTRTICLIGSFVGFKSDGSDGSLRFGNGGRRHQFLGLEI